MVCMNIEDNITKMTEQVEKMRAEVLRLEGSIRMLMALKEGGLKEIDLPDVKEEEKITEIK
jgi:hypothetical protein